MPPPFVAPARAGRIGAWLGGAILLATFALPVLYPVAVGSLLAVLVLAWRDRRPHGCTATALGLTLLAPALVAHAWLLLDQRISVANPFSVFDMLAVIAAAVAAPPVGALVGRLGSLLTSLLLRRERAWLPPALRAASLAALALAASLAAGAGLRLIQRSSLERYAASLPVAAVLPPALGEPSRFVGSGYPSIPRKIPVYEHAVAEFVVTRTCDAECIVSIAAPAALPHDSGMSRFAATIPPKASVAVRRTGAGDLVLIEPLNDASDSQPLAFRGPHFEPTDLYPEDLLGVVGPPLSWSVVAAAGVLFAGFVVQRRRRARERLARLASAAAGTRDEGGWVTFDEPLPAQRLALDRDGPTGRVLVLSGAVDRAVTYRDAGQPGAVEILAGERDDLLVEARGELVRIDALALAAALLTAAPLLAAAWRGFVF
ncbi:hypothetical protein WME76_00730 [Sorangium sp. So ce119]|uniref:hypothetical protein n=1 Tax=Sorangium sp. So ce119 TaxID=3133279 RepID=UPI003F61B7C8